MVKCENCVVIVKSSPSKKFPCVSMNIALLMRFYRIVDAILTLPNKFSFLENRRYKQQTQSIYLYLCFCLNVIDSELLTEYIEYLTNLSSVNCDFPLHCICSFACSVKMAPKFIIARNGGLNGDTDPRLSSKSGQFGRLTDSLASILQRKQNTFL